MNFLKETEQILCIVNRFLRYPKLINWREICTWLWIERSKRINLENIFILMTDRDGCTKEDLIEFDNLPYKNKVVFTHLPYDDINSAIYIKGFEEEKQVGMCFNFKNRYTGKKYYDDFDYVNWFNEGK